MRIISGTLGGQSIPGRPNPKMRPTSDKVKEAIFDQLQARFIESWQGLKVLDLFAGTGALGFEALSRGADSAVFIDHHLQTAKNIAKAAEQLGLKEKVEVLCKGSLDSIRWLSKRGDVFDLIFLDPPYREDWVVGTMNALMGSPLLSRRTKIIVERDKREMVTSIVANWKTETERRYGDSVVTIFSPLA